MTRSPDRVPKGGAGSRSKVAAPAMAAVEMTGADEDGRVTAPGAGA